MAKSAKPLSVSEIKNAKPKEKLYKMYDGLGMYLAVSPTGKKVWRFDYVEKETNKRKTHTIGPLEFVGLSEARAIRDSLRAKLFRNESFSDKKGQTLSEGFADWMKSWGPTKSKSHADRVNRAVEMYVLPEIGHKDVGEITTRDIASALEVMAKKEIFESLKKARVGLKLYFATLLNKGHIDINPVIAIGSDAFIRTKEVKNFRCLKLTEIWKLNKLLRSPTLSASVRCALEFSARNMSRPGEASNLPWREINFEDNTVEIPPERMKMKDGHYIPMSTQSVSILNEMKRFSRGLEYVFINDKLDGPIHRDSLNKALKRANVDSTAHGLRSTASTFLNETMLFDSDVIEVCLAHKDKNKIRAVYNKALYLEERKKALQFWSDIIDECIDEESNLAMLERHKIHVMTKVVNVDIDEMSDPELN